MSETPQGAWVETTDGERVDCLIEQTGPNAWQAVPLRNLTLADMATGHVARLPAGARLTFVIYNEDDEPG